jgi:predicted DNA binding CopG/RHH family protein
MSETDAQPDPQQQPQEGAPPWGDDFDPGRAWSLVQNLREDNAKLKTRPALTEEQQQKLADWDALEQASKTEFERMQEDLGRTKRDAESARAEAVRYKAAATHGIPADHFDLLGSGTEDEITARAEKLAALLAAQTQPPVSTPPTRRPVEQMRPGATPGDAESEDDVLFAQLFGGTK